jgi:hypothetical protein
MRRLMIAVALSNSFWERMNSMNPLRKTGVSTTRRKHPKPKLRSRIGSERFGLDRLEERCLLAADVVVAVPDLASTAAGQAVAISVLANDIAPPRDTLTVSIAAPPAHGTAVVDTNNQITYTPAANFRGFDVFAYTDTSSNGGKSTTAVGVLVDGTAAEKFIINLYNDVLHRLPSAAEVSAWVQNVIGNRTMDVNMRTMIATAFLNSAENHIDQIQADFAQFLGRAGDATGTTFFASAMANGDSDLDVDMAFMDSAEFSAMHTANTDFVSTVFNDVLGRMPTSNDITFFTNELKSMTRAQVVQQIVMSAENVGNMVTSDIRAFVGRTPTASELAAVQGIIQGNHLQMEVAAAAKVLASDEFFNLMSHV